MGVGAGTEHSFQHLCSKKGPLLVTAAPIPYPRTFSALSLWRDFFFFFFFFWERVLLRSQGWPESQRSPVSLVLGLNAYTYTSGIIRDFWIDSMVKKYSSGILQEGGCHGMLNKMTKMTKTHKCEDGSRLNRTVVCPAFLTMHQNNPIHFTRHISSGHMSQFADWMDEWDSLEREMWTNSLLTHLSEPQSLNTLNLLKNQIQFTHKSATLSPVPTEWISFSFGFSR